jgi:tetratricopeptide (TPR) repeat protein
MPAFFWGWCFVVVSEVNMAKAQETVVVEGPGKGKSFFDRAKTVADTGNYDYAVDMYIQGLLREPGNLDEHKALREVSLRRKVSGGKPAGGFLGAKPYFSGKSPKEQMLNAEYLLAKDPGNISHMLNMMKSAALGNYRDIVVWFGPFVLQGISTSKTPNPKQYLEMADYFEQVGEFSKAGEAVQLAFALNPTDAALDQRIKDLGTRETLKRGGYENVPDFKESLANKEVTQELLQKDALNKTEEFRIKLVEDAREEWEQNPLDAQNISKLVKALLDVESDQCDEEAIAVLDKAYKETRTYRYKMLQGDVHIRKFRRDLRALNEQYKAHPEDKELLKKIAELDAKKLAFEVNEFAERAKNFPSDANVAYEYGLRLYRAHRSEEAIGVLQQAQASPKHRADALQLLGRAFLDQGMYLEAGETLQRAIESYELASTGDGRSKEMHYWLARAYELTNQVPEAEKIYSKITQWDFNFRDARQRLAELRKNRANV